MPAVAAEVSFERHVREHHVYQPRSDFRVNHIRIHLFDQVLSLHSASGQEIARYRVSTAAKGAGQQMGSHCTPLGSHRIRARIGRGAALNTVFVGRRPTGEIWTEELSLTYPARDWILTRILWLCGNEPGFNRLGQVDTMRRYVYIHGTPDSVPMGIPGSIGCVRMRNRDIVDLYDRVDAGTPVQIEAG